MMNDEFLLLILVSNGSEFNENKRELKPRDSIRPSCVSSSIRVSQLSTEYCALSERPTYRKKMAAERCGIRTQLQATPVHTNRIVFEHFERAWTAMWCRIGGAHMYRMSYERFQCCGTRFVNWMYAISLLMCLSVLNSAIWDFCIDFVLFFNQTFINNNISWTWKMFFFYWFFFFQMKRRHFIYKKSMDIFFYCK